MGTDDLSGRDARASDQDCGSGGASAAAGSTGGDAAIPLIGDEHQVLTAAYRHRALAPLEAAFAAGERSVKRALHELRVVPVEHLDPRRLVDLDRPEDVENYARSASSPPVDPAAADAPPDPQS
jgi:hypothetical protein